MPRKPKAVKLEPYAATTVRGPREDARWYWRVREWKEGRRDTAWTGWATRKEVVEIVADLVSRGEIPQDGPDPSVVTVRDLCEVYAAHLEDDRLDLSPNTVKLRETALKVIKRLLGAVRMRQVREPVLQSFVGRARREGYAPRTIRGLLEVFGLMWGWGSGLGLVPPGDTPRVRVKVPNVVRHTPTLSDVEKTLAKLEETPKGARLARVLRLQAVTGARIGEVVQAQASDFDADRGVWTVRVGKTGGRLVPVPPDVTDALLENADGEDLWGCSWRTMQTAPSKLLPKACEAAGVTPWTTHGLRRLAVDRLQRAGVDVASAAKLLGHSPQVMLRLYRQVSESDLRKAAAVLQSTPRRAVISLV